MEAFNKIIGYEHIKKELYQVIDMFKNKELYDKIGAENPRGVLLYGEPGLGKTLMANAVIEECGVKSFVLVKNKDNSETLKEISRTFEEAKKCTPSIILIDDIDKFSQEGKSRQDNAMFVAFQVAIDQHKNDNILVIATANDIDKLPTSLLRSGRFDKKLYFNIPSKTDARKIIEYYLKSKGVSSSLNFDDVAKLINYSSCAELKGILNQAAIQVAYERRSEITTKDIVNAYLGDDNSLDEDEQCYSTEEFENTCYHEAGHAVVAEIVKPNSVCFISALKKRENRHYLTGGQTRLCEDIVRRPHSIAVALGGKIAFELYFQARCASGCYSDLGRAASMIRSGLGDSGTRGLGLLNIQDNDFPNSNSYLLRNEAVTYAELERFSFIVKDILMKNKEFYFALVNALKENPILLYSDIQRIKQGCKIIPVQVE